jgi:transposase InsO family protein
MPMRAGPPGADIPAFKTVDEFLRVAVVSEVRAKLTAGQRLDEVVLELSSRPHALLDGTSTKVSARSVYRWYAAFKRDGWNGLRAKRRPKGLLASLSLPKDLLVFMEAEKKLDRYASVPELLRRARERGVLDPEQPVHRVTAWRAAKALGLPSRRVPAKQEIDSRRFSYPHRLMMVLADGKHFRAGAERLKRVALFFLDDCTRRGLTVAVGTSESTRVFLRGLKKVIAKVGLFDALFLDNGGAFDSADTRQACLLLGIHLVYGTPAYPEGHGKIERFNQTASSFVLRGLAGAAEVDPACAALELRLEHFLEGQYNRNPHEALGLKTPLATWDADPRPLRFPDSMKSLDDVLVVTESRAVSKDNVVPVDGVDYEVPRGHARTRIDVRRNLVTGELFVLHDGRMVQLHPVDVVGNATDRRARPPSPTPDDDEGCPRTAASIAFQRDFSPVVGPDGGFLPPRAQTLTGENT